jgi:hypothetical protein
VTKYFSDVEFIVKDTSVRCHKVVLCARSEYFARMFLSGMVESSSEQVVMDDSISVEVFSALINTLYTGKVEIPTHIAKSEVR